MKSLFENRTRLHEDECDVESKDLQNDNIYEYRMLNVFQTNKNTEKECVANMNKLRDFSVNNHMNIKDGIGFTNACHVDNDSEVRNKMQMTSDREKQQLITRMFQGGPNINKGGFEAETDSKMTQGDFSVRKDYCDILSEKSFDRFEPMKECMLKNVQNEKHLIPEWQWGGEGTRDVLSQRDFLENNGYMFDGNVWKKQCM